MRFESPWVLTLLLLLPLLVWWRRRRLGPGAAIRFSWTGNAARAGRSWRQRLAGFVPGTLRLLALALFIVALARPQRGMEQVRDVSEGIAIEMVVDRSSSMAAEMMFEGRRMTRLEVVKDVFEAFVLGDGDRLPGRRNDLVGMVSFARYAETICPLTRAHGARPRFLETVRLAQPRTEEDGTAIGDAVALAAARLKTAEETMARQAPDRADRYEIRSKVMILLTDGRQTAGKRDPVEAARMAADWDIKIYTIAVGGGDTMTRRDTLFGRFFQMGRGQSVDTETLRAIAHVTDGEFYLAEDARSLEAIYEEIDSLERTEIESLRYIDYRELFVPLVVTGLLLLLAEVVTSCTVFRKIP